MKNIYTLIVGLVVTLVIAGCFGSSASLSPADAVEINEKEACNVEKLGIAKVLASAKIYNDSAIKEKVEYRRLGVNNSSLITSIEDALKLEAKMVNPLDSKGKKSKTKLTVEYATWRACTFGLSALQQKHEAKSTWKLAVPGDGFKY